MTLLGWVLSIALGAFSTSSLVFSLWAKRDQRIRDEYKESVL